MRIRNTMSILLLTAAMGGTSMQSFAGGNDDIAKGLDVYKHRCIHCHGENADGKGALKEHLKITPADLSRIEKSCAGCVTDRVLKAVMGRHTPEGANMPLLKNYMSPEDVYYVSEYIKSLQN